MRIVLICLFTTLTTQDLIEDTVSRGYGLQNHQVTTEDGYILSIHRIPYNEAEDKAAIAANTTVKQKDDVVLLMHGMMGTSVGFINQGPNREIAFEMSNAGYDVWLGNARGNPYSRAHETLNPDDNEDKVAFFNFSWEEIAIFDIPAMVDYIIGYTGVTNINFIGDGHGGTSFLILCSQKPSYNNKFRSAQLLNPVGYTKYFPSDELKAVALNIDSLYAMAREAGIVEVSSVQLQQNQSQEEVTPLYALKSIVSYVASLGGFAPVGTSVKQLVQYGQNIRDKSFRSWDYGADINLKIYGSRLPWAYNLSRVTVYTQMYYGRGHLLVSERDVTDMANDMPKARASIMNANFTPIKLAEAVYL